MTCRVGRFESMHFQLSRLPIAVARVEVFDVAEAIKRAVGEVFLSNERYICRKA